MTTEQFTELMLEIRAIRSALTQNKPAAPAVANTDNSFSSREE